MNTIIKYPSIINWLGYKIKRFRKFYIWQYEGGRYNKIDIRRLSRLDRDGNYYWQIEMCVPGFEGMSYFKSNLESAQKDIEEKIKFKYKEIEKLYRIIK